MRVPSLMAAALVGVRVPVGSLSVRVDGVLGKLSLSLLIWPLVDIVHAEDGSVAVSRCRRTIV